MNSRTPVDKELPLEVYFEQCNNAFVAATQKVKHLTRQLVKVTEENVMLRELLSVERAQTAASSKFARDQIMLLASAGERVARMSPPYQMSKEEAEAQVKASRPPPACNHLCKSKECSGGATICAAMANLGLTSQGLGQPSVEEKYSY